MWCLRMNEKLGGCEAEDNSPELNSQSDSKIPATMSITAGHFAERCRILSGRLKEVCSFQELPPKRVNSNESCNY